MLFCNKWLEFSRADWPVAIVYYEHSMTLFLFFLSTETSRMRRLVKCILFHD